MPLASNPPKSAKPLDEKTQVVRFDEIMRAQSKAFAQLQSPNIGFKTPMLPFPLPEEAELAATLAYIHNKNPNADMKAADLPYPDLCLRSLEESLKDSPSLPPHVPDTAYADPEEDAVAFVAYMKQRLKNAGF